MRTIPSVLADPMLHIFFVVALLVGSTAHRVSDINIIANYTPKEAAIRSAFLARQAEELRLANAQPRVSGREIAR